MPNRNIEGNYRYKYQGQEKDPETGMEAFELRLWDSRIGRWITTDPAGQFYSPYLGMGNNPIRKIDPDGGHTEDWYEMLDSDGNGTGQYTWIEGSGYQEGFKHEGKFMTIRDSYNNETFYDGVTQNVYYNGELIESHGGQLDEVVVTTDIRSLGKKTSDFTRERINPLIRVYTKFNTIVSRQANVIVREGLHSGKAYSYDSYNGANSYQELDENWNLVDIPLYKSNDLESVLDVISVTPTGIQTGLGKGIIKEFIINQATSSVVKAGISRGVNEIHSRLNEKIWK